MCREERVAKWEGGKRKGGGIKTGKNQIELTEKE